MQSNQPPSALPPEWVKRIFEVMACTYGSRFLDMWAGQDGEAVKGYWGARLAGFAGQPQAIKQALEALEDRPFPPTLPEFIDLCRSASRRQPAGPAISPPKPLSKSEADRRVSEISSKIGLKKDPHAASDSWARRLRERYLAGERLEAIQVSLASGALGEVWKGGQVMLSKDAT